MRGSAVGKLSAFFCNFLNFKSINTHTFYQLGKTYFPSFSSHFNIFPPTCYLAMFLPLPSMVVKQKNIHPSSILKQCLHIFKQLNQKKGMYQLEVGHVSTRKRACINQKKGHVSTRKRACINQKKGIFQLEKWNISTRKKGKYQLEEGHVSTRKMACINQEKGHVSPSMLSESKQNQFCDRWSQ